MKYTHLSICIRTAYRDPATYSKPVMPRLNKWLGEWLKDFLMEDCDELELSTTSYGFVLHIPMDTMQSHIYDKFQRGDGRIWFYYSNIRKDEFEIFDYKMQ